MRHVLLIEYEYTRVYLFCLALQAVIWRCVHNSPVQRNAQAHSMATERRTYSDSSSKSGAGAIPPKVVGQWLQGDEIYVRELVEGCHNVLKTVVDGLLPNKDLQHCPVRTYFRIISVTSILLKVFALVSCLCLNLTVYTDFRSRRLCQEHRQIVRPHGECCHWFAGLHR